MSPNQKPLVSLPMYTQRPDALAAFWQGLRRHLEDVGFTDLPKALDVPDDLMAHWASPALLMSQTCGYPLMHGLQGKVRYVGTPAYSAPGCEGAFYRSVLVVRAEDPARALPDLRGRIAAYNSDDSQSGYNAFRATIAPHAQSGPFFARTFATGSHARSLRAVRDGEADVACLDCVSFALAARADPAAVQGVRVLDMTAAAPGLPVVTQAAATDEEVMRMRSAWSAALTDPELRHARTELLLAGFEVIDPAGYDVIPRMRRDAEARGYPRLG